MAEALVGGAVLSAFLQVAFDRVASRELCGLASLGAQQIHAGWIMQLKETSNVNVPAKSALYLNCSADFQAQYVQPVEAFNNFYLKIT
ncbi:hypothetical protein CFP56_008593 [Quercus suber]|uniref:Uncharacterized protein n=1 Tax=Quercus suber TaxID=58331 RepID=A0AAW0L2N4_QUESU